MLARLWLIAVMIAAIALPAGVAIARPSHTGNSYRHWNPSWQGTEHTGPGEPTAPELPLETLPVSPMPSTPLLVPAYFEPEGSPNPWQTMCASMPALSTVIANPDNGPSAGKLADYAEAISYCQARGQKVIGYVYTEYGARSLAAVEAQITDYYEWYPSIDGIFLDEMAEQPDEAYYAALESFVHARGGTVVGNPGDTASIAWQLNVVDQVVTFEGTASAFANYTPPAWVAQAEESRIANIIFSAPDPEADCAKAEQDGAGSIYVTNLEEPNPYGGLPLYWLSEIADC